MKIKKGFELKALAGEEIIVATGVENVDFNKIITLNSTAAYLWRKIAATEFTDQELAQMFVSQYDVTYEQALSDSHNLIKLWFEAGIIE